VLVEALQSKIDWKSAISLQRGPVDPQFQVEEVAPPVIFARIVRPMNAVKHCRWQFSHKETLQQTFFNRSAILDGNQQFCGLSPFGGLRDVRCSAGAYWKARSGLHVSVNWTFFVRCYFTAQALLSKIDRKSATSSNVGRLTQNFR